ncbi:hypothetical protein [Paenibacillus sp. An7]|uniref:hypothetical protein n=1 Tax=Paenibacillus sp. An7 TaxID=2689577 RepID=UPI0013585584|nr:hypothetical protein [Paenibacillus sp. An7]
MIKKLLSIAFSLLMLMLASNPLVLAEENQQNFEEVVGRYYKNLDPSGSQLSNNDFSLSKLIINTAIISENITLSGTVTNTNGSIPFSLEGELTKAEYPGKLIGELEDTTHRFNVIYFGFERNSKENISLINPDQNGEILKIYLLDKDNRDLYVYEITDLVNFGIHSEELFNLHNLKTTEHINEFWYAKLIKPDYTSQKENVERATTSGKSDTVAFKYVKAITFVSVIPLVCYFGFKAAKK